MIASAHTNRGLLILSAALVLVVIAIVANSDTPSLGSSFHSVLGANRTGLVEQPQQATAMSNSTIAKPDAVGMTDGCVPAWEVVNSPQLSSNTLLRGVATIAPNDVWAAG